MTERKLLEETQDALAVMKKNLREIQKINKDAGRHDAANAAMKARGKLIVWHAEATEDLNRFFPDHAGEIQTRGGGGR